ncbi:uncharacterized protein LOC128995326 [Macrosteles quadrilineatus]|uniref:uncharacterized protein LOC128995326 n=1 Tax=Macrosteles quadrilineatus TaxID=74068 RepID=UPI0023E1E9FA|nr:uncharacterized protein LOC128995326 [Macrosteles quadrilineatus]
MLILLVLSTFALADAYVNKLMGAEYKADTKGHNFEPHALITLADNVELTCVEETWTRTRSGGFGNDFMVRYMAKLTYATEVNGEKKDVFVEWYDVDGCGTKEKADEAIIGVHQRVAGSSDTIIVKYRTVNGLDFVKNSQLYTLRGDAYTPANQ